MTDQVVRLTGGCHCDAVRFEFDAPVGWQPLECNCSICRRSGYLHLIVPRAAFRLLQGEAALTCYTFNTGVAQHLFCRHCGVKSFYVPRSHPDCYSVNVRCLDDIDLARIQPLPFDGQNWERAAAGLSKDAPGHDR